MSQIDLAIFKEIEDTKEDMFDVLDKKPDPVEPSEIKQAQKEAYRFFKHPIFFVVRIIVLVVPILLVVVGLKFISEDLLEPINRSYLSALLLLVAFALSLQKYVYWRLNSYLVVPNEGLYILKARGLFSITSENVPFNKISTIDLKFEGMGSQMFRYGDIVLASIITNKETGATIILQQIFKPKVVVSQIQKIRADSDEVVEKS